MVVEQSAGVRPAGENAGAQSPPGSTVRWRLVDAGVIGLYLAAALLIYGPLWIDLEHGYLQTSVSDQNMWEWFYSVTAHSVFNAENPLWTDLQDRKSVV